MNYHTQQFIALSFIGLMLFAIAFNQLLNHIGHMPEDFTSRYVRVL